MWVWWPIPNRQRCHVQRWEGGLCHSQLRLYSFHFLSHLLLLLLQCSSQLAEVPHGGVEEVNSAALLPNMVENVFEFTSKSLLSATDDGF